MNESQSIVKNYLFIAKTLHGEPGENFTVIIRGENGQTENLSLGKSQSHHKAFKHNQTDLFLLLSKTDVGKIVQVEFHIDKNFKFKEWKFTSFLIINGIHIYRDITSEQFFFSSNINSMIINVTEPLTEYSESLYYAFIKTGNDSCSKGCYPVLSLFGNNQQHTTINLKPSYRINSSSSNNSVALEKYRFDIFQWQDHNIGNIERMRLELCVQNKESKGHWPIEWMFVIHNGYTFTGRIVLNRFLKTDRSIDINLEQTILSISNEHGDSYVNKEKENKKIFSLNIFNKQANAVTEDIGRYYVIIRNIEGTSGHVYINFHGDRLSSSNEQHLLKCENYPEHPFTTKHTDLFHIKAPEVGQIQSVSLRLDQTSKEHSLKLDRLFVIHNAIVHEFDLHNHVLNKEHSQTNFLSLSHPSLPIGKSCYYIVTQVVDKISPRINASFKVSITGTKRILGPIELKESLTNRTSPFEKECIDLFHIEDDDIGDPISITITLELNGLMSNVSNSFTFERIMLIKSGEYNSLWQSIGDLKAREPKTISLPIQKKSTIHEPTQNSIISVENSHLDYTDKITPLYSKNQIISSQTKTDQHNDHKTIENDISYTIDSNYHENNPIMIEIENHQKHHIFAPTLYEAEKNYRELRRLLRKMNTSMSKAKKISV